MMGGGDVISSNAVLFSSAIKGDIGIWRRRVASAFRVLSLSLSTGTVGRAAAVCLPVVSAVTAAYVTLLVRHVARGAMTRASCTEHGMILSGTSSSCTNCALVFDGSFVYHYTCVWITRELPLHDSLASAPDII